ncbi:hypothetical protein P4O66_019016 [Electrophorus voltai]|uniref:Uncharacterized protein n=1 Tax=Electrophorus voltai TaxID=2609070 RepID=A0AAD8YTM0_9TELE|nr:hypothetical protein P4O66_019016 [Electrophorus voltai]
MPAKTPHSGGVRPDWILYTVPSFAFVLGLLLFSLVCKTQSHRKRRRFSAMKRQMNGTTARQTDKGPGCPEPFVDKQSNLEKQEAQSYENVTAAIYSNQDKVTYYVTPDEDYITPDAVGDAGAVHGQNQNDRLQTPHTLTDTDGESYENMEGCVYSRPRRNALKRTLAVDDDDYIDPVENQKSNLEQTDTESYENMFNSMSPYGANPTAHSSTHSIDDGESHPNTYTHARARTFQYSVSVSESYVRMDSI